MIARFILAILIVFTCMSITHLLYEIYPSNSWFQMPSMYGFYFGMKILSPNNTKNAAHD